jgi:hypothetical protein
MMEVLEDTGGTPAERPQYSPGLPHVNSWEILMLEHELQGQKFSADTDMKQATATNLCKIFHISYLL